MPGASFTPEERKALQEALAAARTPISCPRCGADVHIGMPVAGGGTVHPIYYISCEGCDATLYVSDVPAQLRPKPEGG
jgi:hypothetical protein